MRRWSASKALASSSGTLACLLVHDPDELLLRLGHVPLELVLLRPALEALEARRCDPLGERRVIHRPFLRLPFVGYGIGVPVILRRSAARIDEVPEIRGGNRMATRADQRLPLVLGHVEAAAE